MDVYGYPPYQYTQSDELAKQMFAHQALSSVPYHQEMPEASVMPGPSAMPGPSVMPAPSGSPWNMQGLPWGLSSPPNLVQFTGQAPPPLEPKITPVIHCKRKSLDVEPIIPAKQLITEEKMAAHLNGLHISSEYTPHSLASEELMDVNMDVQPTSTASLNDKLKDKFKVVISEELKKIQSEPLLPPSLIERLEKPHMSLVVWKPKEEILKIKEAAEEDKSETEEEQPKKRNGVLVTEFTGMDVEL